MKLFTSTSNSRKLTAFTLVEMLVTSAIASVLFIAMGSISLFGGRNLVSFANFSDLEGQSRTTLDRMTFEIRQALNIVKYSTNELVLTGADGLTIRYFFNPLSGELARYKGELRQTLLRGCETFCFNVYQRNTTNNTFNQYPASSLQTVKLVELNWICSRYVTDVRSSVESIHSAKVVIRNK